MNILNAFLDRIWNRFWLCFENSVIGKCCIGVGHFFRNAFSGSFFLSALSGEKVMNAWGKSLLGRFILGIFKAFSKFSDKFGQKIIQQSGILREIGAFFDGLADMGLPHIGSFLMPVGLFYASRLNSIAGAVILAAITAAIGSFMLRCPVSFKAMLKGSFIFKFIFGEANFKIPVVTKGVKWDYFILGFLYMTLCFFLNPLYGTALFVLAIGGMMVLWRPEIGLFVCVGLAPFLPTMLVAAMLLGTFLCFVLSVLFGKRVAFKLDTIGIFVAVYAAVLLFYGMTSFAPKSSIKIALLECLFIMGYFLIVSLMNSKKMAYGLIFTYCTAAFLTGVYGFYQYLGGQVDTTWVDKELFEGLSFRVYSTFENPNVYGEYLLLALPMAAVMMIVSKRWISKLYYAGISAVLLANLALTYSRGCYLAIIVAVGVFVCFSARRLIPIGIAGLFALPFVLPSGIISRFASISNLADSSTSYRINIWFGTVRMLEDFWWLGIGLGQDAFNSVYPRYSLNSIAAPHSHSLFLQLLTETGIVGFTIFAAIIFCFINACLNGFKKGDKRMKLFIAAMISAVIAFIFEGFFEHIFYNYRVFLIFFITLGMVSGVCNLVSREGRSILD